jgi:hypothetical protein
MRRNVVFVVAALLLVVASWSAGKAQTRVADFEISIDAPRGDLKVTCARGCDWSPEQGSSVPTTSFRCETERCRWVLNGHGRVTLGIPR